MEGINPVGHDEYIWAMRNTTYHGNDSDLSWKDRRSYPIISGDEIQHRDYKEKIAERPVDSQTSVMASLVPDEVIYNVNDYSNRSYEACLLFGDVSELCEKYSRPGAAGPSRLTQVLNKYLGAMVQEIMAHNGDVLKFSGDAFLAMWKSTETTSMRDAVHEAFDCALIIQKNYGSYTTDVGVTIKVKLAISAGQAVFALIGDHINSHYAIVGKPIWDVKSAEAKSVAGDIIVSPAAFHYTNPNEYLTQEMDDGIHMKVLGLGPNWRRSVLKNMRHDKLERNISEDLISYDDDLSTNSITSSMGLPEESLNEFSLRPAVNVAIRHNIKEDLRKFIIKPVINSIDMDEPFEYLTEMRQVAVMFINIMTTNLETNGTLWLANQSYKIVCSVVEEMKGCVNKVSLFDKDLMIVVIFGLRGLKQELESQMALKSATECQQEIQTLDQVLNVSIGVTTGKTYCGIFGHTLRREYTVISLIVNKAARLMCAYKGKVTCDRETFLHSKMEARNFILQERKELKGISSPGPVYEFKEVTVDQNAIQRVNLFPLLGRDDELKQYLGLLDQYILFKKSEGHRIQTKMLLIKGDARQGKSRFLEECIFSTYSTIPVNCLTLTNRDSKIPFQTVRLLFTLPLGLTTNSSPKDKERKLLSTLRHMKVPDLLCCLNSIFGVNFNTTDLYTSLDSKTKKSVERKMLKQLCAACLLVPWIFVIDDTEYIDEDSWTILDTLLDVKKIFIVATVGRHKVLCSDATKLVLNEKVEVITLNSIDRWFLGGLACQILDVYAIPPELEKVIQARSNGNPGWIESYLISLIQAEGLYILNIDLQKINELGLVCPPLYMMIRMSSPQDTIEWKSKMEEATSSSTLISSNNAWKIYIDSCRDSYVNTVVREQLENKFRRKPIQPVCLITQDFNIADVDPEVSTGVMILKTFDSLSSYEQLLIKCGSILGNQFSRDMLLYVMSASDLKEAALAIQKLFEIMVLSCAKGDFLESGNLVFKERLLNPNKELQLQCECRGLKIEENLQDLPQYASCGYMQFRSSMFRDITYNLLTDHQKKEFHFRALRYLEKETRKCRACGNGFFDRILGDKREENFQRNNTKKLKDNISVSDDFPSAISRRTSLRSGGTINTLTKRRDGRTDNQHVSEGSSLLEPKRIDPIFKSIWGFRYINKLKDSFSLTKAFSTEDFTDCQCTLILTSTYAQLIEHCKGAQKWPKLIDAMLEYSYICILSFNIPLARVVLEEALTLLADPDKNTTDIEWKAEMQKGRVYSLLGYSRMELGQFDEALVCLKNALSEYGFNFPLNYCQKSLKIYGYKLKQMFGFFIFPGILTKASMDYWESSFCNCVSETLSFLCVLYMKKSLWEDAELAATWGLNRALQAFSDFQVICTAYSNMIMVAQHFHKTTFCTALEIHALQVCHLKKQNIDADELKAVAKLYVTIFRSRIYRSDTEKAIQIGYIVLRITASIHSVQIALPILPCLVRSLLLGKHTTNVIAILQDLDYFADEDIDQSGRVWYYALAMTFHLETGYTILPYHDCERFYQVEGENLVTMRDPEARRHFYVVMWLWCIRNEKWEAAALWCQKMEDCFIHRQTDSLSNSFTSLHLLEGLIIYLVSKLDKNNVQVVTKTETDIKNLIMVLEKASKIDKIILPRLYHLQAYFRFVTHENSDKKTFTIIEKAINYAEENSNSLEMGWIEHSQQAWTRNVSPIAAEFWKEHSEPDNMLDFRELEINLGKIGYYTLPVPLYI